jgi:hypothetical protein
MSVQEVVSDRSVTLVKLEAPNPDKDIVVTPISFAFFAKFNKFDDFPELDTIKRTSSLLKFISKIVAKPFPHPKSFALAVIRGILEFKSLVL